MAPPSKRTRLALSTEQQQLADVQGGTNTADVQGGTNTADVQGGTNTADVQGGTNTADVQGGTNTADVQGGTNTADVQGGTNTADVQGGTNTADVQGGTNTADVQGGTNTADVQGGTNTADVQGGTNTADVQGGTNTADVQGGTNTADVQGGTNTADVQGGTNTADVQGGTNTADVQGGTNTADVQGGTNTADVQGGTNTAEGTGAHDQAQTSSSGPPIAEVTINDLPLDVLPLIFNNVSPLTKLKTLALVSKPFRLATQQKAAWTSVKAIDFTKNELDLNDLLKIKLPVNNEVSSEKIEQYKKLIGWLSQIRSIRPVGTYWEYNPLIGLFNLFTLSKHIGTLRYYDKTLSAESSNVSVNQMLEINLLHQGQVKVGCIDWDTDQLLSEHRYNRLLFQLDCSKMIVTFGKSAAARLDSELGRSLQGKSISVLRVQFSSFAWPQSFVEVLNGLTAGSLMELELGCFPEYNYNTHAHIYESINDRQLQSLKKLSIKAFPNSLVKITLPAIVSKTPNLECIKLQYRLNTDRLNDLIIPLWQLRIGRDTDLTQTELTIVSPDVSQFPNKEQVLADLNSRLRAAENGVGRDGGLTFATAQIDRLLKDEWRVRIWEPKTNTEFSLRLVHN